jgi:predicted ester cyclase
MLTGLTVAAQPVAVATAPSALGGLVEQYFGQVLSAGDMRVAETILAPEFERIDRNHDGVMLSATGTKFMVAYEHRAFPDLVYHIDAIVLEGDQAAVCWTASGTHSAAFGAAEATGNPIRWTGMSFIRVHDGKIVEELTNAEVVSALLGTGSLRISPTYSE